MVQARLSSARSAAPTVGVLPTVRLELRGAQGRATEYPVPEAGFLIGTVAGCDLRLPGSGLPPVICLLAPYPGGASLRRLASTQILRVNGQTATNSVIADGDVLLVGGVELTVRVTQAAESAPIPAVKLMPLPPATAATSAGENAALEARARALDEQVRELETDRVLWYQRREEIERDCIEQKERLLKERQELENREQALKEACGELGSRERAQAKQREEVEILRGELDIRQTTLQQREEELTTTRAELDTIRQQLYERYRERRDRLAGLQEAVNRAAAKVQDQKRVLEAEQSSFREQRQAALAESAARSDALATLDQRQQELTELARSLNLRERELRGQQTTLYEREQELAAEQARLAQEQNEHRADLVRLHRLQESLTRDQEKQTLRARELEAEAQRLGQLQNRLGSDRTELEAERTRHAEESRSHATRLEELRERLLSVEEQQAALTTLRIRLDRQHEEQRQQNQVLTERRARLEAAEAELQRQHQEVRLQQADVDDERQRLDQEQRLVAERNVTLDEAMGRVREWQERLTWQTAEVEEQAARLTDQAQTQAEQARQLEALATETAEAEERLRTAREDIQGREQVLRRAEQTRTALQEQLRRRSEELATRQQALTEQTRLLEETRRTHELRQAELEVERQRSEEQLASLRLQIEARENDLRQLESTLAQREQALVARLEQIQEMGRTVAAERKARHEERLAWESAQRQALEEATRMHADLDALRQQLPDLELRASSAAESLTQARQQLREHLEQLHRYARQSQDELEQLRSVVQNEATQLRQRETTLRQAREEHRLSVTAFRQQLIEWQGQVAEMKRALAQDETRLDRRQAAVDQQARQVTEQATVVQHQEREVVARRAEMEKHLEDMREWYRRKIRELTESRLDGEKGTAAPSILTLTEESEPGDRHLSELLQSLNLVEEQTLQSLLIEARKQRRPLRQVLLAGGYLTLFQMALIEAGNMDGLALGPLRLVDRLRATARETVYRVFDPRLGQEAVLRHLAEAEMDSATHPDEFRQRFGQAVALRHPNVAATLEVLELAGRPAVLVEPLAGLPATDWPPLAAVPGVWYRLLSQTALGLHMAHQAGLTHDHLDAAAIVLTSEGVVKVCGLGEPGWLTPAALNESTVATDDLTALGQLARHWATPGRNGRGKPLPDPLRLILERLTATGDERYPTAGALLEELDRVGSEVPPNGEAWKRMLSYVREHVQDDAGLKRSA